MAASVFLVILQSLLPLASLYLTKLIVDAISNRLNSPGNDEAFGGILFLISIAGAVALLGAFLRTLASLANEAQIQAVTDHVQGIIQSKSIEVDLEYYENPQYYDTFHRAQRESTYRPVKIVNDLVQVFQNGISLLTVTILIASLHWVLALVLLVAAIPGVLVRLKYSDKLYEWQCRVTPLERKSLYFHWMLSTDSFAKEMRLFNLGPVFKTQYSDLRKRLRQERLKLGKARSSADLIAQVSSAVALFGSLAFVAYRTVNGPLTLGDMVMYFAAFQQGQSYIQGALNSPGRSVRG